MLLSELINTFKDYLRNCEEYLQKKAGEEDKSQKRINLKIKEILETYLTHLQGILTNNRDEVIDWLDANHCIFQYKDFIENIDSLCIQEVLLALEVEMNTIDDATLQAGFRSLMDKLSQNVVFRAQKSRLEFQQQGIAELIKTGQKDFISYPTTPNSFSLDNKALTLLTRAGLLEPNLKKIVNWYLLAGKIRAIYPDPASHPPHPGDFNSIIESLAQKSMLTQENLDAFFSTDEASVDFFRLFILQSYDCQEQKGFLSQNTFNETKQHIDILSTPFLTSFIRSGSIKLTEQLFSQIILYIDVFYISFADDKNRVFGDVHFEENLYKQEISETLLNKILSECQAYQGDVANARKAVNALLYTNWLITNLYHGLNISLVQREALLNQLAPYAHVLCTSHLVFSQIIEEIAPQSSSELLDNVIFLCNLHRDDAKAGQILVSMLERWRSLNRWRNRIEPSIEKDINQGVSDFSQNLPAIVMEVVGSYLTLYPDKGNKVKETGNISPISEPIKLVVAQKMWEKIGEVLCTGDPPLMSEAVFNAAIEIIDSIQIPESFREEHPQYFVNDSFSKLPPEQLTDPPPTYTVHADPWRPTLIKMLTAIEVSKLIDYLGNYIDEKDQTLRLSAKNLAMLQAYQAHLKALLARNGDSPMNWLDPDYCIFNFNDGDSQKSLCIQEVLTNLNLYIKGLLNKDPILEIQKKMSLKSTTREQFLHDNAALLLLEEKGLLNAYVDVDPKGDKLKPYTKNYAEDINQWYSLPKERLPCKGNLNQIVDSLNREHILNEENLGVIFGLSVVPFTTPRFLWVFIDLAIQQGFFNQARFNQAKQYADILSKPNISLRLTQVILQVILFMQGIQGDIKLIAELFQQIMLLCEQHHENALAAQRAVSNFLNIYLLSQCWSSSVRQKPEEIAARLMPYRDIFNSYSEVEAEHKFEENLSDQDISPTLFEEILKQCETHKDQVKDAKKAVNILLYANQIKNQYADPWEKKDSQTSQRQICLALYTGIIYEHHSALEKILNDQIDSKNWTILDNIILVCSHYEDPNKASLALARMLQRYLSGKWESTHPQKLSIEAARQLKDNDFSKKLSQVVIEAVYQYLRMCPDRSFYVKEPYHGVSFIKDQIKFFVAEKMWEEIEVLYDHNLITEKEFNDAINAVEIPEDFWEQHPELFLLDCLYLKSEESEEKVTKENFSQKLSELVLKTTHLYLTSYQTKLKEVLECGNPLPIKEQIKVLVADKMRKIAGEAFFSGDHPSMTAEEFNAAIEEIGSIKIPENFWDNCTKLPESRFPTSPQLKEKKEEVNLEVEVKLEVEEEKSLENSKETEDEDQVNDLKTFFSHKLNDYSSVFLRFFARIIWFLTFGTAFDLYLDKQNLVENAQTQLEKANSYEEIQTVLTDLKNKNTHVEQAHAPPTSCCGPLFEKSKEEINEESEVDISKKNEQGKLDQMIKAVETRILSNQSQKS